MSPMTTTINIVLYQSFDFNDIGVESKNESLWNQGYTIIANTNTILNHLSDINDTPLTQAQFDLLRGESLALRAMLHFDILRRHGAIYALNPDAESIPYQDDTSREIKPFLSNKEAMEKEEKAPAKPKLAPGRFLSSNPRDPR